MRYNLQKRAYYHSHEEWDKALVDESGEYVHPVILHYVGGKPWNTEEELSQIDWEDATCKDEGGVGKRYQKVFKIWRDLVEEGGGSCSSFDCVPRWG